MEIEVFEEKFTLLPEKAVYWLKNNCLLLADVHLGKINHFRKSGIPLPLKANDHNIEVLVDLLQRHKPHRVIFLGDLFHSHYNTEWEVFGELISHFKAISFELVLGNHDIMSELQYQRKGIIVHNELTMGKIKLMHHPAENLVPEYYYLAGHVHPGVQLAGKGRQAVTLPCFYFGMQQALLPAFGVFTGLSRIRPQKRDKIYVIADGKIIDVGIPVNSSIYE